MLLKILQLRRRAVASTLRLTATQPPFSGPSIVFVAALAASELQNRIKKASFFSLTPCANPLRSDRFLAE